MITERSIDINFQMSVMVIGKHSFLAQSLYRTTDKENWIFQTHAEILEDQSALLQSDVVINFAMDPRIVNEKISAESSFDVWVANKIKGHPRIHFFMVSTRQVYGQEQYLSESLIPIPKSLYGRNKLDIEIGLLKILGNSRLTILRCSNVFGFELGRRTFFGAMLSSLQKSNSINFDLSLETKKDVISVVTFCNVITKILHLCPPGIYNLGSGVSIKCGDLAQALIDGYGQGSIQCSSEIISGQFFMDVEKLTKLIGDLEVTKESIGFDVGVLGAQLSGY